MSALLLQPQNLDGLAADQQAEDDVGRSRVPVLWGAGRTRWVGGAGAQGLGDHGRPEAGLNDARDGEVARERGLLE